MPSLDLLKAIAREGVLTARAGMYPFARLRKMPQPGPAGSHTPVVLVHGFLGHRDMLRPIARRLYSEGWDQVARVGYPSATCRLEDVVDAIREVVVPLAKEHGKVDLIGHSLGALASRAWIKALGGDRYVRRFVSLGGPHAGTTWYFVSPPWLHEALSPDGPWPRLLNQGPEPVPTTVIRARYDHQVFPPARAAIGGVHEVVIGGYGHNGMLWAPEAHEAIVNALSAPD